MLVELEFKDHPHERMHLEQDGDDHILHMDPLPDDEDQQRHSLLVARRQDAGIYETHSLHNFLTEITDWEEDKDYPGWPYFHHGNLNHLRGKEVALRAKMEAMMASPHSYGVADNLEQIKEYAEAYWLSSRSFILCYHWVTREGSPGWRWHKNGTYIGTQESQAEHIGDEPVIERVVSWSFYEIKRKQQNVEA